MVKTENSPRAFKHIRTMSFRPTRKQYIAIFHDQEVLLNERLKLIAKYRHENKLLLGNYKANN